MAGVIDVALGAAGASPHRAACWVDAHALHRGEVDDQSIVAAAKSGAIVATAANGDQQIVVAPKVNCTDDVRNVCATRNHAWALVDHAIVERASLVIALILRFDDPAAQASSEIRNRRCHLHDGFPSIDRCIRSLRGPEGERSYNEISSPHARPLA